MDEEVVVPGNAALDGTVIDCDIHELYYGEFKAVRDVALKLKQGTITAFIGPSGCGKSTVLRCLNRMNDIVYGFRLTGSVMFRGVDIYAPKADPITVRRNVGMVFQQPNPFSMSIFRNVAFGLQLNGYKGSFEAKVEQALRRAALWDEVKDKLRSSGLSLSGGQQQRLCIARAIATEPAVLLMDEPCSGLDPISTRRIEELMLELKKNTPSRLSRIISSKRDASRIRRHSSMLISPKGVELATWWSAVRRPKSSKAHGKDTRKNTFTVHSVDKPRP